MAMRPHPICAIFILLLGALFPNTVDGTMVGKLLSSIVPAVAVADFFKKLLLLFWDFICDILYDIKASRTNNIKDHCICVAGGLFIQGLLPKVVH